MEKVPELANAVGDPWGRTRVVGVRVDRDARCRQVGKACLLGSAIRVEAARRDHHELRPRRTHVVPRDRE
jgi:hypothetical protein